MQFLTWCTWSVQPIGQYNTSGKEGRSEVTNVDTNISPPLNIHARASRNEDTSHTVRGESPSSSLREDRNASNILKDIKLKKCKWTCYSHLNINSTKAKFSQLKEVIKDYIDILVITEPKLDDSFPTNQFLLEGYSIPYRNDVDKNSRGVMIFVRDDLACKEIQNIVKSGEGIFLELNLRKTKWLLFGGYNHKKTEYQ